MAIERRRYADQERVGLVQALEVAGRLEGAGADQGRQFPLVLVLDVAAAGGQGLDLGLVDVKAEHPKATVRESHAERQPDIAEADHPHPIITPFEALDLQVRRRSRGARGPLFRLLH